MKKRIWDLYAPIYEKAMRADKKLYACSYYAALYGVCETVKRHCESYLLQCRRFDYSQ